MDPSLSGTEVHSITLYAMLALITILLGIVGFFLSRVLNRVDKMWDIVQKLDFGWQNFSDDVGFVKHSRAELKEKMDDIVILRRDQISIWKKIDELKAQVGH